MISVTKNPIELLGLEKCQRICHFSPVDALYYVPQKELYACVLSDGYLAVNAGNGWTRSVKFKGADLTGFIELSAIRDALSGIKPKSFYIPKIFKLDEAICVLNSCNDQADFTNLKFGLGVLQYKKSSSNPDELAWLLVDDDDDAVSLVYSGYLNKELDSEPFINLVQLRIEVDNHG